MRLFLLKLCVRFILRSRSSDVFAAFNYYGLHFRIEEAPSELP